jgi:hypothetical protein
MVTQDEGQVEVVMLSPKQDTIQVGLSPEPPDDCVPTGAAPVASSGGGGVTLCLNQIAFRPGSATLWDHLGGIVQESYTTFPYRKAGSVIKGGQWMIS